MLVQIHVSAAELRKLAPGESPVSRHVWRVVTDDRPRHYVGVYDLRVSDANGCRAVTDFHDPMRHGEAWLVARAECVFVQAYLGAEWQRADHLDYPLPFESDEK